MRDMIVSTPGKWAQWCLKIFCCVSFNAGLWYKIFTPGQFIEKNQLLYCSHVEVKCLYLCSCLLHMWESAGNSISSTGMTTLPIPIPIPREISIFLVFSLWAWVTGDASASVHCATVESSPEHAALSCTALMLSQFFDRWDPSSHSSIWSGSVLRDETRVLFWKAGEEWPFSSCLGGYHLVTNVGR